ncbi:MAG: radical SAM/SPASM domain-containing protein [bacterium]
MTQKTRIRLTKDSFVRNYKTHGYITNQLIKNDRIFNETGADFLSQITREPETIEIKVNKLLKLYEGVGFDELCADFIEFAIELEQAGFILSGNSEQEINSKEPSFTFIDAEVKTAKKFFSEDFESKGTFEIIYEELIHEHQLTSLTIEVTKQCNEVCVHCYLPEEDKKNGKFLPLKKLKDIIDEACEMGLLQVTFTGGEPLLHPDFFEILRYAREKDLMISVLSNLTLVTERHTELFKEINLNSTQVSLYSMDGETHDFITQLSGSFEKTMNAIQLFLKNDIPIAISCPVINKNYHHFKDVLKWAEENRISASTDLDLSAQTNYETINLSSATTPEQNKELLQEMLEEDKDWQNAIINEYAKGVKTKDNLEQPPCSVGNDSMFISCEGIAYPCPSWQSFKIADLNTMTLKEAWDDKNPKVTELRKIKRKDFLGFVNSPDREFMNLCMARNANNNQGDYMTMDAKSLEIAKMTKELVDEFIIKSKGKII